MSQSLVVALTLVGVGTGEVGDGPVGGVAVAEVGGDSNSVGRAGVGGGRRTDPWYSVITEELIVSTSAEPFQSRVPKMPTPTTFLAMWR